MRYELVIVALWALAIAVTAMLVKGTGVFTFLGPLYAICMIGSVITVRRARGGA